MFKRHLNGFIGGVAFLKITCCRLLLCGMGCSRAVGWEEGRQAQEEGDINIIMTDSCCRTAQTNTF